jgi:hypothetical protein
MPRSIVLGGALSALVAACALFSEPVPDGTVPIPVRITNNSGQGHVVAVTDATSLPIAAAVQPSGAVPAHSTVDVTIYAPLSGKWEISISDWGPIPDDAVIRTDRCPVFEIVLEENGAGSFGGCPNP